jgi:stage II sporulation protein D
MAGCTPRAAPTGEPRPAVGDGGVVLRVAIVGRAERVRIGGTAAWQLAEASGDRSLVNGGAGEEWQVERSSGGAFGLRAVSGDGRVTSLRPGLLLARPTTRGALVVEGRAYRGTMAIVATDTGLLVINHVPLEEYLRGVVPLELGPRPESEREALAAQAVASRSYAFTHRRSHAGPGGYDLVATVLSQAYGGVLAETAAADAAIARTGGLMLLYGGRPIGAVYHSTCGGSTAAASEVWRSPGEPYLQPVSDRIPGTESYYCSASPRFRWTRELGAAALDSVVGAYLPAYSSAPRGRVGAVRDLAVEQTTRSGRVGQLAVRTEAGTYHLRGNDVRFVLRDDRGGILPSTYFSLTARRDATGTLRGVTVTGRGNGHGIGMCQWGAIGRARAGQDFRQILGAYYPGAIVARAG